MIPFLITLIFFTIPLRNDDVQEFDTRWDAIPLSMTKIPPDYVLESLYKLRTFESDQLKTVLEMYDMEIQQNISMADYQRLKAMLKRSILPQQSFSSTMEEGKPVECSRKDG